MKRVLNIGCGNDNYGTDRIDVVKTPITTKVCDSNLGLPYKNKIFDEVYTKHILEHLTNPYFVLQEIKRVLKDNGKWIVICDNPSWIPFHSNSSKRRQDNQGLKQNGKNVDIDDVHCQVYFVGNLLNLAKKAGFKKVSLKYYNPDSIKHPKHYLFQKIGGLISKKFFYSAFKGEFIKK